MRIDLARNMGFCYGVRRAIDMALKAAQDNGKVQMLGEIVHNKQVVKQLSDKGITVIQDMAQAKGGVLVIRAHGASPEVYQAAQRKMKVVDATCPMVREIHEAVRELEKEGYRVVLIGDHGHDEVLGTSGQIRDITVFAKPEEVREFKGRLARIGVVVQSTQTIENVQAVMSELIMRAKEIKFVNTICKPTRNNQEEVRRIAHENDVIIIIGSFTSANTRRLAQISRSINPRTYQVESADDIHAEWFEGAKRVGVSAGASTPDWVIQQAVEKLRSHTRRRETAASLKIDCGTINGRGKHESCALL